MKLHFKLFIWLIILVNASCKKDRPISGCNCYTNNYVCTDAQFSTDSSGNIQLQPTFLYDTGYVSWPYFNPNNSSEIIYCKDGQLIKYNLSTSLSQILYSGGIIRPPKWGRNGWILLNVVGAKVYKINANGDSLTQLTYNTDFAPEWNYSGDKFMTQHSNSTTSTSYNSAIFDIDGNLLDTLPDQFGSAMCWQNESNLFITGLNAPVYGMQVVNVQTHSATVLFSSGGGNNSDGIETAYWYPDGQNILYTLPCGVYKINYITKGKKFNRRF